MYVLQKEVNPLTIYQGVKLLLLALLTNSLKPNSSRTLTTKDTKPLLI